MRGGKRPGAGRPKGSKDRPNIDGIFDCGPKESKAEINQNPEFKQSKPCNEKQPETFDGASGELVPLLRNPRLATLKDIRLEMSYIYKRMENRLIETADGSKLIFALSKIGEIITVAEFEERIEQLEKQRQEILADRQRALPAVYAEG